MRSGQRCDPFELVRERDHAARIERCRPGARHARELFAPLGPSYDRVGAALSLGQDPLWRRFLVSRLPPGGHVLDVATGTGLVAEELLGRGFRVTGLDQSPDMLAIARRRFGDRVELVEASAEALPFGDGSFDHLTFTYLLRYVDDPAPRSPSWRAWCGPAGSSSRSSSACRAVSAARSGISTWEWACLWPVGMLANGWGEVGGFLGDSIRAYWDRYPLERQLDWWEAAGLRGVEVRRLSLGGGVVMWGTKA